MRKIRLAAAAAGLLLLAALVAKLDPAAISLALGQVPPGQAVAALLVVQVQVVLSALRWRFTAFRLGHAMPVAFAVREYSLAGFLNQILPGGIAGDAARVYRSSDEKSGGWKRAATAVVLERLSGQIAFLGLTGLGLATSPLLLPATALTRISQPDLIRIFAVAAAMTAIAAVLALLSPQLRGFLARLRPDIAAAFWSERAWVTQSLLSVLVVGSYVLVFMIASAAVGATLPATAAVTIVPLCLLSMLLPIGIGGWGTREAAAAALWPLFGFTAAQGVAASLFYGLMSLVGTAIPGLTIVGWSLLAKRIGRS